MKFKYAIFDLDGTLVDSLIVWKDIWAEFGRIGNIENFTPRYEDDKLVRTLTLKDAMYHIANNYPLNKTGDELVDIISDILIDFYSNKVLLKKGVIELLEYLQANGVKMCIASATEKELINVVINRCNLSKYFSVICSCKDIGVGKDKPDIYYLAVKELGASIEDCCLFEDSLVAIKTGKSIGLKVVGIYDEYNFGHSEMKEISDFYIDENSTILSAIKYYEK